MLDTWFLLHKQWSLVSPQCSSTLLKHVSHGFLSLTNTLPFPLPLPLSNGTGMQLATILCTALAWLTHMGSSPLLILYPILYLYPLSIPLACSLLYCECAQHWHGWRTWVSPSHLWSPPCPTSHMSLQLVSLVSHDDDDDDEKRLFWKIFNDDFQNNYDDDDYWWKEPLFKRCGLSRDPPRSIYGRIIHCSVYN